MPRAVRVLAKRRGTRGFGIGRVRHRGHRRRGTTRLRRRGPGGRQWRRGRPIHRAPERSAGVALLAATTIESHSVAVAYLGLVALGTVIGMVALTVVMSRPITWTMRRGGRLRHAVTVLAALLSMTLGLSVLVRALVGDGAL